MTEPIVLKLHCLDFWRLLNAVINASENEKQARWFFFDQHIATCPRCQAFLAVPQQYGPDEVENEA